MLILFVKVTSSGISVNATRIHFIQTLIVFQKSISFYVSNNLYLIIHFWEFYYFTNEIRLMTEPLG